MKRGGQLCCAVNEKVAQGDSWATFCFWRFVIRGVEVPTEFHGGFGQERVIRRVPATFKSVPEAGSPAGWSSRSQALLVTDSRHSPSSHWFYPLGGSCAASLCENSNKNVPHSISSQPEAAFAGFPCLRGPACSPLG